MSDRMNVRLVTEQTIANLICKSDKISIVRSGFYDQVGCCVDEIRKVCAASKHRKVIRIILPSLWNPDVVTRARSVKRPVSEIRELLDRWHEALASLGVELAEAGHSLEVRTTMHPHRYHAFIGNSEVIFGFAWHRRAALGTTSFALDGATCDDPFALENFVPDFNFLWDESHTYHVGDNKKFKSAPDGNSPTDKIFRKWGGAARKLVAALRSVKDLQTHYGNGVTADQVAASLGGDRGDWNKRLLRLEQDGFVRKVKADKDSNTYGRVITTVGLYTLPDFERMQPNIDRQL